MNPYNNNSSNPARQRSRSPGEINSGDEYPQPSLAQDPSHSHHRSSNWDHRAVSDLQRSGPESHRSGHDSHRSGHDSHRSGHDSHRPGHDPSKPGASHIHHPSDSRYSFQDRTPYDAAPLSRTQSNSYEYGRYPRGDAAYADLSLQRSQSHTPRNDRHLYPSRGGFRRGGGVGGRFREPYDSRFRGSRKPDPPIRSRPSRSGYYADRGAVPPPRRRSRSPPSSSSSTFDRRTPYAQRRYGDGARPNHHQGSRYYADQAPSSPPPPPNASTPTPAGPGAAPPNTAIETPRQRLSQQDHQARDVPSTNATTPASAQRTRASRWSRGPPDTPVSGANSAIRSAGDGPLRGARGDRMGAFNTAPDGRSHVDSVHAHATQAPPKTQQSDSQTPAPPHPITPGHPAQISRMGLDARAPPPSSGGQYPAIATPQQPGPSPTPRGVDAASTPSHTPTTDRSMRRSLTEPYNQRSSSFQNGTPRRQGFGHYPPGREEYSATDRHRPGATPAPASRRDSFDRRGRPYRGNEYASPRSGDVYSTPRAAQVGGGYRPSPAHDSIGSVRRGRSKERDRHYEGRPLHREREVRRQSSDPQRSSAREYPPYDRDGERSSDWRRAPSDRERERERDRSRERTPHRAGDRAPGYHAQPTPGRDNYYRSDPSTTSDVKPRLAMANPVHHQAPTPVSSSTPASSSSAMDGATFVPNQYRLRSMETEMERKVELLRQQAEFHALKSYFEGLKLAPLNSKIAFAKLQMDLLNSRINKVRQSLEAAS